VFEAMGFSGALATMDIIIGIPVSAALGTGQVLMVASNLLFFEFGVMLVVGGCLMARQPLKDNKTRDEDGSSPQTLRLHQRGMQILLMAVFTMTFSVLLSLLSGYL
jgi:hypothetical protein